MEITEPKWVQEEQIIQMNNLCFDEGLINKSTAVLGSINFSVSENIF